MPHSKRNRLTITRHLKKIDRHLLKLQNLYQKHSSKVIQVKHPYVTLGQLRDNYSPHHLTIPPEVLKNADKFRRFKSDSEHPLAIYGRDGGLIAYRTSLNDPSLTARLTESVRSLPRQKNHQFRGINRGSYSTRHLTVWSPYAKKPFISTELKQNYSANLEFLKTNTSLWDRLSDILGQISPSTYKQFLRYPLPKDTPRFCTAWAGCVVNSGDEDPVQTKAHRDVKEAIHGFSCIVPAGNFTGGALILYDLEMVVELKAGDIFMFPDSLIHHANEAVQGERHSVIAFTQQNLFHYWERKYKSCNNNDKRAVVRHTKKTLNRVKGI